MFTLGVAGQATVVFFGKLYIYQLTSLCLTFHYGNMQRLLWPVLKCPTVLLELSHAVFVCKTVIMLFLILLFGWTKAKWVMIFATTCIVFYLIQLYFR